MNADEKLEEKGIKFEELSPSERDLYFRWLDDDAEKPVTMEQVKIYLTALRENVEIRLTEIKETPEQSWLSLLSLFIPIIGIIRKWYQDQKILGLRERLRVYLILEAFLFKQERLKAMQKEKAIGKPEEEPKT